MKEHLVGALVIAAVIAVVMIPVVLGAKRISAEADECAAGGGVHVRTYEGFTCIKNAAARAAKEGDQHE